MPAGVVRLKQRRRQRLARTCAQGAIARLRRASYANAGESIRLARGSNGTETMRSHRPTVQIVVVSLVLTAAVALAGFLMFANYAARPQHDARVRADGIVALTGSAHRILEAGRLLADGHGQRLFVTGVNRIASRDDIRRLTGLSRARFSCCVDIDYRARNTIENASETRRWIEKNGFASIIVVTAGYHMPRSLTELRSALPDVEIHAHPVAFARANAAPWWSDADQLRLLMAEYAKLISAFVRVHTSVAVASLWPRVDAHDEPREQQPARRVPQSGSS